MKETIPTASKILKAYHIKVAPVVVLRLQEECEPFHHAADSSKTKAKSIANFYENYTFPQRPNSVFVGVQVCAIVRQR